MKLSVIEQSIHIRLCNKIALHRILGPFFVGPETQELIGSVVHDCCTKRHVGILAHRPFVDEFNPIIIVQILLCRHWHVPSVAAFVNTIAVLCSVLELTRRNFLAVQACISSVQG